MTSATERPLPSMSFAPSHWLAAVAPPQRKSLGKRAMLLLLVVELEQVHCDDGNDHGNEDARQIVGEGLGHSEDDGSERHETKGQVLHCKGAHNETTRGAANHGGDHGLAITGDKAKEDGLGDADERRDARRGADGLDVLVLSLEEDIEGASCHGGIGGSGAGIDEVVTKGGKVLNGDR